MNSDFHAHADSLWRLYRHIFPEFSRNHFTIYTILCTSGPRCGENLITESGLSRGTVYAALRELCAAGLVAKSGTRPAGYSAANPMKAYSANSRRVISRLRAGKKAARELFSSGGSKGRETFAVEKAEGSPRLVAPGGAEIKDGFRLMEIRRAAERQLIVLSSAKGARGPQ